MPAMIVAPLFLSRLRYAFAFEMRHAFLPSFLSDAIFSSSFFAIDFHDWSIFAICRHYARLIIFRFSFSRHFICCHAMRRCCYGMLLLF